MGSWGKKGEGRTKPGTWLDEEPPFPDPRWPWLPPPGGGGGGGGGAAEDMLSMGGERRGGKVGGEQSLVLVLALVLMG